MGSQLEDKIHRSRMILQNPYAYLNGEGGYDAVPCKKIIDVYETRRTLKSSYANPDGDDGYSEYPLYDDSVASSSSSLAILDKISTGKNKGRCYSRGVIKNIARNLQREMWFTRKKLFPARDKVGAMDILDPLLALKACGYTVQVRESLGQYLENGRLFEVAGIHDNSNDRVQISRRFSPVIRNFTTAHELGHAVLHEGTGLHRDRALDGSSIGGSRDFRETEADVFAAYFLLPEKQVRIAFEKIFLTQSFTLEENTAFALTSDNLESLQDKCRTLRDLVRVLAGAECYNGVHVISLTNKFKVSTEVMAIRLEDLRLVKM